MSEVTPQTAAELEIDYIAIDLLSKVVAETIADSRLYHSSAIRDAEISKATLGRDEPYELFHYLFSVLFQRLQTVGTPTLCLESTSKYLAQRVIRVVVGNVVAGNAVSLENVVKNAVSEELKRCYNDGRINKTYLRAVSFVSQSDSNNKRLQDWLKDALIETSKS